MLVVPTEGWGNENKMISKWKKTKNKAFIWRLNKMK